MAGVKALVHRLDASPAPTTSPAPTAKATITIAPAVDLVKPRMKRRESWVNDAAAFQASVAVPAAAAADHEAPKPRLKRRESWFTEEKGPLVPETAAPLAAAPVVPLPRFKRRDSWIGEGIQQLGQTSTKLSQHNLFAIAEATGEEAPASAAMSEEAPAQVAHVEDNPVEAKPAVAEVKPVGVEEVKPVGVEEVKPIGVEEVKPVGVEEVKPIGVEEVKPVAAEAAEVKPVAAEAAEVKPVAAEAAEVKPVAAEAAEVKPVAAEAEEVKPEEVTPADPEALTPEALTTEALTNEALTNEALTPEALTPEALTNEALTPEALAPEALTPTNPEAVTSADQATTRSLSPSAQRKIPEQAVPKAKDISSFIANELRSGRKMSVALSDGSMSQFYSTSSSEATTDDESSGGSSATFKVHRAKERYAKLDEHLQRVAKESPRPRLKKSVSAMEGIANDPSAPISGMSRSMSLPDMDIMFGRLSSFPNERDPLLPADIVERIKKVRGRSAFALAKKEALQARMSTKSKTREDKKAIWERLPYFTVFDNRQVAAKKSFKGVVGKKSPLALAATVPGKETVTGRLGSPAVAMDSFPTQLIMAGYKGVTQPGDSPNLKELGKLKSFDGKVGQSVRLPPAAAAAKIVQYDQQTNKPIDEKKAERMRKVAERTELAQQKKAAFLLRSQLIKNRDKQQADEMLQDGNMVQNPLFAARPLSECTLNSVEFNGHSDSAGDEEAGDANEDDGTISVGNGNDFGMDDYYYKFNRRSAASATNQAFDLGKSAFLQLNAGAFGNYSSRSSGESTTDTRLSSSPPMEPQSFAVNSSMLYSVVENDDNPLSRALYTDLEAIEVDTAETHRRNEWERTKANLGEQSPALQYRSIFDPTLFQEPPPSPSTMKKSSRKDSFKQHAISNPLFDMHALMVAQERADSAASASAPTSPPSASALSPPPSPGKTPGKRRTLFSFAKSSS